MTIRTCDICGAECKTLLAINERYACDGVAEMCESCRKDVDGCITRVVKAMNGMHETFVKRAISNLRRPR